MAILDEISAPADVKNLPAARLGELAAAVRERIIRATGECGGHLSSNLGAVELEIALLRVFDPPRDAVLFDVSHQTYAWKMLTGRAGAFSSLRRTDGISGFQRRCESPMDAFGAGHAGTALSAAMGFAAAKMCGASPAGAVVAVVGDAAAGNGISLEALDDLLESGLPVLVVLNDNSSAAPPGIAERFAAHALKSVGPIDGHDIGLVEENLKRLRDLDGPRLLRVATQKGRGFAPAERDPEAWHSTGPFDPETGVRRECRPGFVSWSDAFGDFLLECAEKDPAVFAITAAMTAGTGLSRFAKALPGRFRDVGIREAHQGSFAAGLAAAGMKPVVAVYSTFFQREWDSFVHDAALQRLPVLLALDRAGVVPGDGATHHGVFDIALLRPVPGVVVMQPRSPAQLRSMVRTALAPGAPPCAIRWPRGEVPDDSGADSGELVRIGSAVEISRTGAKPKVAIWTLGPEDAYARQIAAALVAAGVDSAHVDARFAKPVDEALLAREAEEGVEVFFTWEDGVKTGGFGEEVRGALQNRPEKPSVVAFGWPDEFLPHATSREDLMARCGLEPAAAAAAIMEALAARRKNFAGSTN